MTPQFKVGDTFTVPVQFIDSATQEAIEITSDMTFTCAILDSHGNKITTPKIDVLQEKGYLLISDMNTSSWAIGYATLDIKLMQGNAIRHSQDFRFEIKRSITP